MKTTFKGRLLALLLALAMLLSLWPGAAMAASDTEIRTAYDATRQTIFAKITEGGAEPENGSTYGEWAIIGTARDPYNKSYPDGFVEAYIKNVTNLVVEKEGKLSTTKYSEYSRTILGLTAVGVDVTDVGGYNLLTYLTDMNKIKAQGINGPVWALIALDCHDYEIPTNPQAGEQATRDKLIQYILDKELTGGGWSMGSTPDDMTGMAVQALAPYYSENAKVKAAVDRAVTVMAGFDDEYYGTTDASGGPEAVVQVMMGLMALGLDPVTDARFIDNGKTLMDRLMSYYSSTGKGFSHTTAWKYNQMATEQAYYCLTAYYRVQEGKSWLYDMTDIPIGILVGDVNGDGYVTSRDASMILRYSIDSLELTPDQLKRADVNNDGHVTSRDASAILRMSIQ